MPGPVQRMEPSLCKVATPSWSSIMHLGSDGIAPVVQSSCTIRPRPCTTPDASSPQWADAEGRQTYRTSSQMLGIQSLVILAEASAKVL